MSGSQGSREDEFRFLAPGRGGDGGGDDEDERRDRMPGCLGLFAGRKKLQARTSAGTGRVAAAPPPQPPSQSQDVKEPAEADVKELQEDDRRLPMPGRGGDGGGEDDEERQDRMSGCLGLFAARKKRQARSSARTGKVAAAPPPQPPSQSQVTKELAEEDAQELAEEDAQELATPDAQELATADVAELPAEIDCLIVSKIPNIYDRSSLQGVCSRWRSATLSCTSTPLPLIVNADYTLSNYFAEGADCVPQKMNPLIKHPESHPSTCLGALDNWIVIGYEAEFDPQANLDVVHNKCSLLQPIKGGSIPLPSPSSFQCIGARSGSLQILDGNGIFTYAQPARESRLRLQKVALWRSAGLMNFKVAALAIHRGQSCIILCRPDSKCWTISSAAFITIGSDIQFVKEKLFVLGSNQSELFLIDFGPDLCLFPMVCLVRRCGAVVDPPLNNTVEQKNVVQFEDQLLLVIRYLAPNWEELLAVRVFQFDADSLSWTEKESIGSMAILISLSSSQSIDASGRKEISSDHIYFLDHFCPQFLPMDNQQFSYRSQKYSLPTGIVTEHLIGTEPASRRPGYPMWFFPCD